jgi:GT2 family glycosyltransferase
MITVARQPRVGIVGAKLLYPDGTIQHAGMFQRGDGVWDHFGRGRPASDCQEVRRVPAVSAACLLIGRALFEQLNGFDEERPITHNDVDLCRRARARGHLIAVTPKAQLLHYESLSRGYTLTSTDA